MKISFYSIILSTFCSILFSCKKDNYKEPSSALSGKIVYKGEAINVENYQVPYQLYQFGFGKVGSIDGSFTQEGTYAAVLFNGNYKLIIPTGRDHLNGNNLHPAHQIQWLLP